MENIISVDSLEFSYTDTDESGKEIKSERVIDGVTLDIQSGEKVAVLGHNGSGKSTLAKHMNAIFLPCGGKVYVNGIDTVDESRLYDVRSNVGMVFQNPDNQLVATIVEEDAAFALENMGVAPDEIRSRVDEALKAVGMYEYRNHSVYQLSGGQKQRIAVAGVIAMRPKCIVMDEPTAMLDPSGRKEVMNTIHSLNKQYGITIVLITHYMDEAAQMDRVVVMNEGKILLDGEPKRVFSQVELLKSVGLDVPQSTELLFELSQMGIDIENEITDVDECVSAILRKIQK